MGKGFIKIMKNLVEFLDSDLNYKISTGNISIKDSNSENKERDLLFLKNIRLSNYLQFYFDEKIILFTCEIDEIEDRYILFSTPFQMEISSVSKKYIIEEEMNVGIFAALFEKLEYAPLPKSNLVEEEIENILEGYSEQNNVIKYEYSEMKKLFNHCFLYKLKKEIYLDLEEEEYLSLIYRIIGLIKCEDKLNNLRREKYFTKECLDVYIEIFDKTINYFPYDNLLMSLSFNSSKYIFLEIYRMIEKLYPFINCYQLKGELSLSDKTIFEIHQSIFKCFNWKHKERDSINHLFSFVENKNSNLLQTIEAYKNIHSNQDTKLGNFIYDIRNSSVHLSFLNQNETVNVDICLNKDTIIRELITIIGYLYEELFD